MNEMLNGSDMARTIQLATAPVFLLAGIGAFLNVIAGRLARVVDRSRYLEDLHGNAGTDELVRYVQELRVLEKRMNLASRAIYLGTASGLAVCMLVVVLFVGELIDFNLGDAIAILFVVAMALLAGAMILFLRETRIAVATLHVREELLQLESEIRHDAKR
jgi:pilus assembly protein TadC